MGLANHMLSLCPSVHHFVQKGELLLCLDPITFGCSHHVIQLPFLWCLLNPLVQVSCFHIPSTFLHFLATLFNVVIQAWNFSSSFVIHHSRMLVAPILFIHSNSLIVLFYVLTGSDLGLFEFNCDPAWHLHYFPLSLFLFNALYVSRFWVLLLSFCFSGELSLRVVQWAISESCSFVKPLIK